MRSTYPHYRETPYPWIGQIPSHWSVKPFRRVFEESSEINGKRPVGVMLSVSGYRGVEPKVYESDSQVRSTEMLDNYRVVRPGQLVVNTMWLNYAGLGISEHLGHVSPAYRSYWIREEVDRRYIHHLMRSEAYVKGYTGHLRGIRPNSLQMDRATLMVWPILLPPLSEQRAIAEYLDREISKIDKLIEEQQRLIDMLRERRTGIIHHLLTPRESWSYHRVKHVANTILGKMLDGGRPIRADERMTPYVRAADVRADGSVNLNDLNEMPFSDEDLRYFALRGEDILVIEGGATVGRPGFLYGDVPGVAFQKTVNRVRVRDGTDARFVYWSLLALYESDFYSSYYGAVSFVHLTGEKLREIPLSMPRPEEQRWIAAYLDEQTGKIDALIAEAKQFIELSKERRAALITAAVTGQIDVRDQVDQGAA